MGRAVENNLDFLGFQPCFHLVDFQIDNLKQVRLFERVEHGDLIQTIEKLRFKDTLRFVENLFAHRIVILTFARRAETECRLFLQQLGADVRGHDDDGVPDIDLPA